jgi:hypothetical protein
MVELREERSHRLVTVGDKQQDYKHWRFFFSTLEFVVFFFRTVFRSYDKMQRSSYLVEHVEVILVILYGGMIIKLRGDGGDRLSLPTATNFVRTYKMFVSEY